MPFSSIINKSLLELLLSNRKFAQYYVIDYFNNEMKLSLLLIDYIRITYTRWKPVKVITTISVSFYTTAAWEIKQIGTNCL